MARFSDWIGPQLDGQVEVHLLRTIVRSEADRPAPLANLLRSDVASRLYLLAVFAQALSSTEVRIPAKELAGPLGLAEITSRRTARGERPEIRALSRAGGMLVRNGLVTAAPGLLPIPTDLYGCGFRLSAHESRPVSSHRPGHHWHHRHDLTMPAGFWTRGWVTALSAIEHNAVLALLAERADERAVTMRAAKMRIRYGMSDDSWHRAHVRLAELGLVERVVRSGTTQSYAYRLRRAALMKEPRLIAR